MANKRKRPATASDSSIGHGPDHLATLYTYGFQFNDTNERDFISECVACGHGPAHDIAQMMSFSLMQSAAAWDQLIACARSLQARDGFLDPLCGRDLLTFVARVLAVGQEGKREKRRKVGNVGEIIDERQSVVEKSRTKAEKGSRKGKESPFWASTPAADDAGPKAKADAMASDTKRDRKKEKRRQRRRSTQNDTEHSKMDGTGVNALAAEVATPDEQPKHLADGSITANRLGEDSARDCPSFEASIPTLPANCGAMGGVNELNPLEAVVPNPGRKSDQADRIERPSTPENRALEECLTLSVIKNAEMVSAINEEAERDSVQQFETPKRITRSSFFATPTPKKLTKIHLNPKSPRPPRGTVSCLPFPRLDVPRFGVAQENYMDDPYRLLIAVTFLIRTKGVTSMPVFRELITEYPTPKDLKEADPVVIEAKIRHLGLSNNRTASIQKYARIWEECPPKPGARYGVKNYPNKGDGKDVRAGELLDADDPRESAWEIGHLTQGRYAIDSWRIFCRDIFLGKEDARFSEVGEALGTKRNDKQIRRKNRGQGKSQSDSCLQPEWMRVMPEDKELRAYLRWMWMREGWEWDPLTGDKIVLSREMHDAVQEGRVVWDNTGKLVIVPADENEQD